MDLQFIKIQKELERRREILIRLSNDDSFIMSSVDRGLIKSLLERWEVPDRPSDIPTFMKQFCVSVFSYAPLRKYLTNLIGDIPMRDTIARALSLAFNENEFVPNSNWFPETLGELAAKIQVVNKYNLASKQFRPRIIAVLLSGTAKMAKELVNGLDNFYKMIPKVTEPSDMWELVNDFSRPIKQVGPTLICDFFKEIGFTRYVKIDHHFKKQFPGILPPGWDCNKNTKHSFILSQEIADKIGMTPFHLDFILYLWGRYGSKSRIGVV